MWQSIQEWTKWNLWKTAFKQSLTLPLKKFLKAVFHKFYLVTSWILCPKSISQFSNQIKHFHFSSTDKKVVMKEINNLKPEKPSRDTDISIKILKLNWEFFAKYICSQFNTTISFSKFPASFKFAHIN